MAKVQVQEVYGVGNRVQLTKYDGREIIDRVVKIERSVLGLDCTSKIYLSRDPTTPHSLDSFQEFETLRMRVISDNSKLSLLIRENRGRK